MYCLHCGDCCKRMSPLGSPCKYIIEKGLFIFCKIYSNRPALCENHSFPSRYCPVGAMTLKINDIESIHKRVDEGYNLIHSGLV